MDVMCVCVTPVVICLSLTTMNLPIGHKYINDQILFTCTFFPSLDSHTYVYIVKHGLRCLSYTSSLHLPSLPNLLLF